jgi:hypothetical protein
MNACILKNIINENWQLHEKDTAVANTKPNESGICPSWKKA